MPKSPVGSFIDPKTKEKILIYAKKGETPQDAIKRVATNHAVSPSKVSLLGRSS